MEYVSKKGEGTHKRNLEAYLDDEFDDTIGQRALGKGKELILNKVQYEQARRWVLFQYQGVHEWRRYACNCSSLHCLWLSLHISNCEYLSSVANLSQL